MRPANRLGEILLVGLAEYRGHQVRVVTGEHEEHPQEYDEANGAGVHGHGVLGGAGSPRGNVARSSAPIGDPRFTGGLLADSGTGSAQAGAGSGF